MSDMMEKLERDSQKNRVEVEVNCKRVECMNIITYLLNY